MWVFGLGCLWLLLLLVFSSGLWSLLNLDLPIWSSLYGGLAFCIWNVKITFVRDPSSLLQHKQKMDSLLRALYETCENGILFWWKAHWREGTELLLCFSATAWLFGKAFSKSLTVMRAIWEVPLSQAKSGSTSTIPLFQLDFITGSSLPSCIAGMFNQNKTNFHKLLNSDLGLFLQINWYWNNYFSESAEEKDVKRKLKSN